MPILGHNTVVSIATGMSATYSEADGVMSLDLDETTDLLDSTAFNDGRIRSRVAALADYSVSMEADFEPADTAYLKLRAAYDAGNDFVIRVLYGGTTGYAFTVKASSIKTSASVEDKVKLSISAESGNGVSPVLHT
jgi:hypothetical protein